MTAPQTSRLEIVPVTFEEACSFVADHHRHQPPPPGDKFTIGVTQVPSEMLGRSRHRRPPCPRHFDNGQTLEVTRTATDGTRDAWSALYGAARRGGYEGQNRPRDVDQFSGTAWRAAHP